MKLWEKAKQEGWLRDVLADPFARNYWASKFEEVYQNSIDSWAYRWTLACWLQSGLTILPNVNLVSNIGFDTNSTHTKSYTSPFGNMPTEAIEFPLLHPPFVLRNKNADEFTQKTKFGLIARGLRKVREIIGA